MGFFRGEKGEVHWIFDRSGLRRFFSGPGLPALMAPGTWGNPARKTVPPNVTLAWGRNPEHIALRDYVLSDWEYTCICCGICPGPSAWHGVLVIDHIISIDNGGSNHPMNLQPLCRSCNSSKAGLVDCPGLTYCDVGPRVSFRKEGPPQIHNLSWTARAVYFEIVRLSDERGCFYPLTGDIPYLTQIPDEVYHPALREIYAAGLIQDLYDGLSKLTLFDKEHNR